MYSNVMYHKNMLFLLLSTISFVHTGMGIVNIYFKYAVTVYSVLPIYIELTARRYLYTNTCSLLVVNGNRSLCFIHAV